VGAHRRRLADRISGPRGQQRRRRALHRAVAGLSDQTGDGRRREAGGFQPLEAYDVVVANLDTALERRPPAEDPVDVLAAFDYPLATAEVAAVMAAPHLAEPDREETERALIATAAEGLVVHRAAGDGALWSAVR